MKIIHVLNSYLPNQIAGTEVYVSALIRGLRRKNILSKVLIPNYSKNENEYYFYEETEVIKYAEPSTASREIIIGRVPPKGIQSFLDILDKEKPDIVHFHELAGSIGIGNFHVEASKKAGFINVMTFHVVKYSCKTGTLMYMSKNKCGGIIDAIRCSKCWLHYKGEKGLRKEIIVAGFSTMNFFKIDTRFIKNELGTALAFPKIVTQLKNDLLRIEQNTAKFVILTPWYKDILIRNGINEKKIALIYQGLPINNTRPAYKKKYSKKLRVIFIGRISHFKGVDILLSALKHLNTNSVELDIYGSTDDEAYLQKCQGISIGMNNIAWRGNLDPAIVIETIQQYDIICIPSAVSEMGPFVLKEAFAAGIPVLASDVYGNAEQIKHGINGLLFTFNDSKDLLRQLNRCLDEKDLLPSLAKNIIPPRSFDKVGEEYIELYKSLLN